jgi:transposase
VVDECKFVSDHRRVRERTPEPCFETFKQWRVIATRYDKLAVTYRGGVVLRAITVWLKVLGDTP